MGFNFLTGFYKFFISFLFWGMLPLYSLAVDETSSEQLIKQLRQSNQLEGISDSTLSVLQSTCECSLPSFVLDNGVQEIGQTICQTIVSSKICKGVESDDLIDCSDVSESTDFDLIEFFTGCAEGLFDSAMELIAFVWDVLKWAWNSMTHPGETYQEASEYIESVKTYLVNEYDKAYDESDSWSSIGKSADAAAAVGYSIAQMLFKGISDYLYQEYQEFGCLNFQARTQTICKVAGEIIIPPVGALALLKYGAKGVKASDKLQSFIKNKKEGKALNKRKNLGESSLNRSLTSTQVSALEKAHLAGKGQKGKSGKPAGIGNYTLAQLREKVRILNSAGFSDTEIRKLMEDGVVGVSSGGFAHLFRSNTFISNAPDKISLSPGGNPSFDNFRKAFNGGRLKEGDNQYVSYTDLDGEIIHGQVVSSTGNKITIQKPDGQKLDIKGDNLNKVIQSSAAKQAFNVSHSSRGFSSKIRTQPPRSTNILPRASVVKIGQPVAVPRSAGGISNGRVVAIRDGRVKVELYDGHKNLIKDVHIDRVMRPMQEGDIVSIPRSSGGRSDAKISKMFEDGRVRVDGKDSNGPYHKIIDSERLGKPIYSGNQMNLNVSANISSYNFVNKNLQGKRGIYNFEAQKIEDYHSRVSGHKIEVNFDSPNLQKVMAKSVDIIQQRTGIRPQKGLKLSQRQRHQIYRVWLDDIVKRIEDRNTYKYGKARNDIMSRDQQMSKGTDLGLIANQELAVCRELSIFASVLFSEYGMKSIVGVGKVGVRDSSGGRHAWLEVYDDRGHRLEIVDSNNTRTIHPDREDYESAVRGITYEGTSPMLVL